MAVSGLISVIVPVYNVEKYLPRCIDSILGQSLPDFELILVDDGSPDECGSICDAYAARDARIRVIHQENRKVAMARNAGLDAAKGEWIAFIDPDDWVHRDYLKLLCSGAKTDTDIVMCACLETGNMDETDADLSDVVFRDVTLADVQRDRIARTRVWGRLHKKAAIGDFRFISGTEPAEDSVFNELFFNAGMHFRFTDAKLYYYFMRMDSAVHDNLGRHTLNAVEPVLERLGSIEDKEKRRRIIIRSL